MRAPDRPTRHKGQETGVEGEEALVRGDVPGHHPLERGVLQCGHCSVWRAKSHSRDMQHGEIVTGDEAVRHCQALHRRTVRVLAAFD